MKFRFETILKIRKNKEVLAQKVLATVNVHYLKQQENLDFMESVETKCKQNLNQNMEQGTNIPTLILYNNFFRGVRAQEIRQTKIVKEVATQMEIKRAELAEAMARRRIMEILKERDLLALTTAQGKRETALMDEVGATQWRLNSL